MTLELLCILWQPIVTLATGQVLGHEALARFADATPDAAFQTAARLEQSVALDRRCVALALADPPPEGLLFLNVTAATVRTGRFPPVPRALRPRVVWELPEAAGWEAGAFLRLPPGTRCALDDLGAGAAELGRAAQVPWQYLKVDRRLIAGCDARPSAQAVIHGLVVIAQDAGGAVIAEGVETAAEAACLRRLGVAYGQGYFWARPAPRPAPAVPAAPPSFQGG